MSWWVASAQQLDSRPAGGDDDISATSLRLVEHVFPAKTLDDLVTRLEGFPLPREGVEFELVPQQVEVDGIVLTCRMIEMTESPPAVPDDRRTHLGWT